MESPGRGVRRGDRRREGGGRARAPVPGARRRRGGARAGLRRRSPGCELRRTTSVVVLPVDCPLVTPTRLRELAEARAVPQTGPLPGAYTKAMLPELEARVARRRAVAAGRESDGRSTSTSALLANVNTRMDLIVAAVADWAGERDDVQARRRRRLASSRGHAGRPLVRSRRHPARRRPGAVRGGARRGSREFGTPVAHVPRGDARRAAASGASCTSTGEDVDFVLFPVVGARPARAERERGRASRAAATACSSTEIGLEERLRAAIAERPRRLDRSDSARARPSSRATSGTTRSGRRRSSAAARCSPPSTASTAT